MALMVFLAANGCSGSGLVDATGRLTYQGKPVPSTQVTFLPEDGGRPSHGVTDDDGNFTLKYSRTLSGVARGKHTVFIKYDLSVEEELKKIPPKASKELRAVITKFGDPKTSPFHYEVTQSGQHFDIKLDQ
jgi:hypothetical protein